MEFQSRWSFSHCAHCTSFAWIGVRALNALSGARKLLITTDIRSRTIRREGQMKIVVRARKAAELATEFVTN